MKIRGKNLVKLLAGTISLLMLSGCVIDHEQTPDPGTGDEAMITFSIQLPSADAPASRAMSEEDENAIKSIRVVAFKDGVYSYRVDGTSIQPGSGKNKKTFTVVLRKGEYDLVIIANDPGIDWTTLAGKNKADAMELLETTSPGNGQWGTTNGDKKSIPMWGNVGAKNIGTDEIPPIPLLRMVARVNVTLTEEDSKFELKSVHLYNYNANGRLAPSEADWDVSPVTAPNLPAFPNRTKGPVIFNATTMGESCINEIYMFEAVKGSKTTLPTNPCIVVGGTYEDSPAYYRIDFATDADNYLNIMRNHSYDINITGVKNAGHTDPGDAFESGPENIIVEIIEWNDGSMGEIGFDGQNYLSVSQSEFNFTREAINTPQQGKNVLYVMTDVPGGWSIKEIKDVSTQTTSPTWIQVTSDGTTPMSSGGAGTRTTVVLAVGENSDENNRSAIIYLEAGRLIYPVTVNQSFTQVPDIYVGRFGGELKNTGGDIWEFTELLYVQREDESTSIKWSEDGSNTQQTGDDKYIDGRKNTYDLHNNNKYSNPAASLCYNKNSGTPAAANMTWYLPAQKQLMAVWVAHESFGVNNKLNPSSYYWSATENSASSSWLVNFEAGTTNIGRKNSNGFQVRCVREY